MDHKINNEQVKSLQHQIRFTRKLLTIFGKNEQTPDLKKAMDTLELEKRSLEAKLALYNAGGWD